MTSRLAIAAAIGVALAHGMPAALAHAAPLAPQAACTTAGWQHVPLPNPFVAQSLAVDVAAGRQRLYAGTYRASSLGGAGSASVRAIDLNALTSNPFTAFDPSTMPVLGVAVRPDSGRLAAGLAGGGIVHAEPDGVLGVTLLQGRTARAIEAADGTTFAGATDQIDDVGLGTEKARAHVWRQRGDEPWSTLTGDVERFNGYFWDLALDRNGRLWASLDGDGLFTIADAASDAPGAWTAVGDATMRSRTAESIAVDPADARIVYAGLRESVTKTGTNTPGSYGLRISHNGGATFTGYGSDGGPGGPGAPVGTTPFRASQVASVVAGPRGGWVFASVWGLGLFVSEDAGAQWHRLRLPAGTGPGFQVEPYMDVMATARFNGTCELLYVGGKDGLWARTIADIAAEKAHAIFLPATLGAPWDIQGRPAAADAGQRDG
ncbi:MAG: hypothetical protein IT332_03740 [Ardenticatenales bacterium]|nr:hypothetical protein [Ardenticatenales bacterium]